MIVIKEHETPHGGLLLAVCDKELLGKSFEEDEFQISCPSAFYEGREVSKNELSKLLDKAVNVNIVGDESLGVALELGIVEEKNIKSIGGTRYAFVVKADAQ